MSLVTAVWDAIKDPLMKEVERLKDEVEETFMNLREAIELLQASNADAQKEGLQKIQEELNDFLESEVWRLISKSKSRHLVRLQNLLLSFQELLQQLIDAFDDEEKRDLLWKQLQLKNQRILKYVEKLGLTQKNSFTAIAFRIVTVAAPAIAIYFLSQSVLKNNHFAHTGTDLVNPREQLQFEPTSHTYQVKEAHKSSFVAGFEKDYFGIGWEPEDDMVKLKVSMQNNSSQFPLPLSTLGLEVHYEALPFEWNRLNTEAKMNLSVDSNGTAQVRTTSIAPAMEVHITSSLGFDTIVPIMKSESTRNIRLLGGNSAVGLEPDRNTFSDGPFYFSVPNPSHPDSPAIDTLAYTVDELERFLKGTMATSFSLTLHYKDVADKEYQHDTVIQRLHYLLPVDSPYFPSYTMDDNDDGGSFMDHALKALGHQAVMHPDGLQLYKDSMSVRLDPIEDGATKYRTLHTDVVMNPDGVVVCFLKLKNRKNGIYHVRVLANEQEVAQFQVEGFAPTETFFKFPKSLQNFK